MILESIVTTVDAKGQVNIAPMGPLVNNPTADHPEFTLRPFSSSRTYQNLSETNCAVIHVTDDVNLFAQAAVDKFTDEETQQLVRPVDDQKWWVLKDCHRWFAVEIQSRSGEEPRIDMTCRVVRSEVVRPFFGFNRAKHAVIEAAIIATRTHILPHDDIHDQMSRLQPLIDKTAGDEEHRAFEFLRQTIQQRTSQ